MAVSLFTRNYLYTAAYQLFTLFVPLVTAPYLARVLGASNVGINSYVVSVTALITTFGLLGVYSYGNRSVAYLRDDRAKLNQLFWELMLLRATLLVVTSVAMLVLVHISRTPYTVYVLAYYPWVLAVFLDVSWVFVGVEKMKPVAVKNFLAKAIVVVGMFVVVQTPDDAWKYLCLLSFGTLVANLSVYRELRSVVSQPSVQIRHLGRHLVGASQLFLPQVATVVYLQAGKVLIEALTGSTAQVAFYDQAEKIVLLPMTLITVLNTVMMPRLANDFRNGRREAVDAFVIKAGRVALFAAVPCAVGMGAVATWLIPWYLGAEFGPTALAVVILSPIIVTNALESVTSGYFMATDRIGKLLSSYVAAATVAVLLNVVLVPHHGFAGSAVATLCASFVCAGVQLWWLRAEVSVRPLVGAGSKFLLFAVPMGIASLAIGFALGSGVRTTFLQAMAGVALYVGLALLAKDHVMTDLSERARQVLSPVARRNR